MILNRKIHKIANFMIYDFKIDLFRKKLKYHMLNSHSERLVQFGSNFTNDVD